MGVRILDSDGAFGESGAILFDSVTGWTIGPLFEDRDEAEAFLDWLAEADPPRIDVRRMSASQLEAAMDEWRKAVAS